MAYTDIDKPSDYFNTVLYTGNGSGQTISGVGFQPDFNWTKCRTATQSHVLTNSVSGVTKTLFTNATQAETTLTNGLTSFNSDGYAFGDSALWTDNTKTFVSWNWKAGTSFTNDASATGIGSIDSTGSVNTNAGFSIVTYTGNGSASQSVAHGLGVAPSMIIVKKRSAAGGWVSWHKSLSGGSGGYIYLSSASAAGVTSGYWGSSVPSSTTFGVWSTGGDNNENGSTFIAYCFAEKKGYSKFGSYTGNGNVSGSYIHLGFKPAWIMVKNSSGSNNWLILDSTRDVFNLSNKGLYPNINDAESGSSYNNSDILSNGFKIKNAESRMNTNTHKYIYMAFAENPFVTSTGVPATAR
jgi:hypothetical protein